MATDVLVDENDDNPIELALSPIPLRFVRLHPQFSPAETLSALETVDDVRWIKPVPWSLSSSSTPSTPNLSFYAIPGDTALKQTTMYQQGRVYGQDVSSGQAVNVLLEDVHLNNNNDHEKRDEPLRILDLCTSPGLKLCAIIDSLGGKHATVVGVDISMERLHVCMRILQKYQSPPPPGVRIQLYCGDGTTFGDENQTNHVLVYDSHVAQQMQLQKGQKRLNKSGRRRERQLLRHIQEEESLCNTTTALFDYVLVDAECSTDGSLRHVRRRTSDEAHNTTPTLLDLQHRLLKRGLSLLQPSTGSLVYATCSVTDAQNCGVVESCLLGNTIQVVPVRALGIDNDDRYARSGRLAGTMQFLPNTEDPDRLFGSGLYLAKLRKKEGG